jgi:hypothetical protein
VESSTRRCAIVTDPAASWRTPCILEIVMNPVHHILGLLGSRPPVVPRRDGGSPQAPCIKSQSDLLSNQQSEIHASQTPTLSRSKFQFFIEQLRRKHAFRHRRLRRSRVSSSCARTINVKLHNPGGPTLWGSRRVLNRVLRSDRRYPVDDDMYCERVGS